ncbi:hypothetical protein Y1Q_0001208 [Alligator mississippiensis]|uniref:Uncharacterized protein n=1 Tax=Alligator mississippiensis TaxID=8496 RepID=A0A151PEG7_ALLMI|nr:hypothetical protein Y1Q_0001208 [Alligator mississippiensis]
MTITTHSVSLLAIFGLPEAVLEKDCTDKSATPSPTGSCPPLSSACQKGAHTPDQPGEVRKETLQATRGAGNKESKQGSLHAVHWKQEEEGKEEQGTRSCSGFMKM